MTNEETTEQPPLIFTNRDCIECFAFQDRELHFMLNTIKKIPGSQSHFSSEIFVTGGSGKHRSLSYREFYILGMIKTLNNIGFTIPDSAHITFNTILKNMTPINFHKQIHKSQTLRITPLTKQTKLSLHTTRQTIVTAESPQKTKVLTSNIYSPNQDLFTIEVNLYAFSAMVAFYVERR